MESSRRRSTSVRQLELLIMFMDEHRDLALGRVRSREARALATRLWTECSSILNAEGVARSPKDWSKFWNDYKCRVRQKMAAIRRDRNGTGGGPGVALPLTALEEKVISILGADVGPLPGVRMDPIMDVERSMVGQGSNGLIVPKMNQDQEAATSILNDQHSTDINLADSPIINLSTIANIGTIYQLNNDTDRTLTIETPPSPPPPPPPPPHPPPPPPSPPPPPETEAPITIGNVPEPSGRNMRRGRGPHRSRPRRLLAQSNTSALEEARASIARIEEMRARTEEATALANLKRAEADLKNAESFGSIAQSLRIIAESIQAYLPHQNTE